MLAQIYAAPLTKGRRRMHGPYRGAPNVRCERLLPSIKHEYESPDNIIFTVITLQLCSVAVGSLPGARRLVRCNKSRRSICVTLLFLQLLMTVFSSVDSGGLMRFSPHLLQPRGLRSNLINLIVDPSYDTRGAK